MEILNRELRRRILEKALEMKNGHCGSAFSCVDAIKYLYDHILREGEDKFILSKGHGEMALFAVLESLGKKPAWTIHLNYNEQEGIYATTGSLGHGLPIGLGRAFAKKIKGEDGRVYVLTGDGEMEEGSNWESLLLANRLGVDNLILLIDYNKHQALGPIEEIGGLNKDSLVRKLDAFNYQVSTIDGHDIESLAGLREIGRLDGLKAIILDTVKGKGSRYLEEKSLHVCHWHNHLKEYQETMEALK